MIEDDEALVEVEEVRTEMRACIERAQELLCEAKLTLRQQQAADPLIDPE